MTDARREELDRWHERIRLAAEAFPAGCWVRVVESDVPRYVGLIGVVLGHESSIDEFPLIGVRFDEPERAGRGRDGFYEDELRRIDVEAPNGGTDAT